MAKIKIRDWVEPAHPVLVQRYDDILDIYRFLKGLQDKIDAVFDKVSKQVGFVVTTTLPVTMQVSDDGKIEKFEFTAANLQGTLFGNEFARIFKEQIVGKGLKVSPGSYPLLILWHDALKLKLKADWIEPAHFRASLDISLQATVAESVAHQLNPGVREPAHWFDAGILLDNEEKLLIAAIDEVYTDLKLSERVAIARRETIKYIPGVREPAHFRAIIEDLIETRASQKLRPGVREPAHFRRFEELLEREDAAQLLAELTAVMKKYGV